MEERIGEARPEEAPPAISHRKDHVMCGIVGIGSSERHDIDADALRRMCRSITRRGPDDEGFYFGDYVGLGMRRLAIIDVKTGHQPVCNEDKSIWVVFNGEIYNYRELRAELSSRGHTLTTASDTECLVHLYEDYGEQFVTKLRGMFACAIWDEPRQKLLLVRDRLGIKPLYYAQHRGKLYFGSELKCLLTVDGLSRDMNMSALSDYVAYKYVPGPRTIYESIHELLPGHLAIWSDSRLEVKRYWALSMNPEPGKPFDYFREGLLHHLKDAIDLHLVSEVPLGAFLSGGIDSSAIVALMAKGVGNRAKTFTVGFGEGQLGVDERPFARTIAQQFGTDHSECLYENPQAQIGQILPQIIRAFDEPFADSSVVPNYLVCEAARKWVTVALSGTGGDELFAGYERYRGTLLAEHVQQLPVWLRRRALRPLVKALPESRTSGLWIDRIKRFFDGEELALPLRYQRYLSAFDDNEKQSLFSGDLISELNKRGGMESTPAMLKVPEGVDQLEWMLHADLVTYLPDDELRKTDRLSMWHSLEVRVPFLDHKLVEFIATIPSKYKLKGWEKKHVLVQSLKGLIPDHILRRRKQGFSIPLAYWLREPLRDLVQSYLSPSKLKDVGLFNVTTVNSLLDEHRRLVRNHETKIWVLLTFMIWHELYISRQPL
jgi:asparagine synthase (glutamine-hydrolysing)